MSTDPAPPEDLLEGASGSDAARLTLRWALERIASLEKAALRDQEGLQEALRLRDRADRERDEALREVDARRRREVDRERHLEDKERSLLEMQRVLTGLFKGELDVAEFQRRRRELEKEGARLEGTVRKRLAEAREAHQAELSEVRRACEDKISGLERRQAAELEREREKGAGLKEELLADLRLQADEYHQKALLLEIEFSERRKRMEEDFARLRTALLREKTEREDRPSAREQELFEKWASEREKLIEESRQKDERLRQLERRMFETEAARFEETARQIADLRRQFEGSLEALRRESEASLLGARGSFEKERVRWAEELARARPPQPPPEPEPPRAPPQPEIPRPDPELHELRLRLQDSEKASAAEKAGLLERLQALQNRLDRQQRERKAERSALLQEHQRALAAQAQTRPAPAPSPAPQAPPAPPPPALPAQRGRLRWALLAAAAAGAAAFFLPRPEAGRDHPLSFPEPCALAWQGDDLWAADCRAEALHRLHWEGGKLSEIGRYDLPHVRIAGLAADGDRLYLSDPAARQIQRWVFREGAPVLDKAWPSPDESPGALYFDGKRLWSCDAASQRLYKHAPDETLAVEASYPETGKAAGLAADAAGLWLARSETPQLIRRRWDSSLIPEAALILPEAGGGPGFSGFALRGEEAWLTVAGESRLLQRPLRRFKPQSSDKR